MMAIWVDERGALIGRGPSRDFDPGIGRGRYRKALDLIRSSGEGKLGFASFTFDSEETGSVVVIPETIELTALDGADGIAPRLQMIDDGTDAWRSGFAKSMLEIDTGRVEKVVLARRVKLAFSAEPDPLTLIARLLEANPGCFLFSVGGLVGASPELLVSLRNGRIKTLALAGTATSPIDLETVKISEEHRHVARSVTDALRTHLTGIDIDEQVIVPHGAMSHVGTRIEGPARPGTTVVDILEDLHPTAAVAGFPTQSAIELIREIEPESRGRYAGPVGWMDARGDGVFAIALRCGQISGKTITLWAGGGLVAGSEEEPELAETELKLAPMLDALRQTEG